MKSINYILLLVALLVSNTVFAQESLKVEEAMRPMSKGSNNAFTIEVPQTKSADLQKSWTNYLKDKTKAKVLNEKGEIYLLGVIVNSITDRSINIYSRFQETTTGTVISVFYQIDDTFVSTENNPTVAVSAKTFLYDFGKIAYLDAVQAELEMEQKVLKNLEKELENLHKEEDKELKNIDKEKREIEKAEDLIKVKKNEQDLKQKEITAQKEKMIGVNLNAEEKKLQDKLLKDLEGDKKSLIKDQDNARKNIIKSESSIKNSERNLANIKSDINAKNVAISKQKELITKVEEKLNRIKRL